MLVPTRRSWRRRPASPASRRRTPRPSSIPCSATSCTRCTGGEKVELRGFGSLRLRRRELHRGRNPRTGDRVDVPSKRVAYFKPGKELKELIDREPAPAGPAASSSPASMSDAGTPLSRPEGRPGRSAGRHDQRVRSAGRPRGHPRQQPPLMKPPTGAGREGRLGRNGARGDDDVRGRLRQGAAVRACRCRTAGGSASTPGWPPARSSPR